MSDLLIKGMDLPKEGRVSLIAVFSNGDVKYIDRETFLSFYLPQKAIELRPHGDLIDRQKLLEHRFEVYDSDEEVCEDYIETYHVIEAPTIIEASNLL